MSLETALTDATITMRRNNPTTSQTAPAPAQTAPKARGRLITLGSEQFDGAIGALYMRPLGGLPSPNRAKFAEAFLTSGLPATFALPEVTPIAALGEALRAYENKTRQIRHISQGYYAVIVQTATVKTSPSTEMSEYADSFRVKVSNDGTLTAEPGFLQPTERDAQMVEIQALFDKANSAGVSNWFTRCMQALGTQFAHGVTFVDADKIPLAEAFAKVCKQTFTTPLTTVPALYSLDTVRAVVNALTVDIQAELDLINTELNLEGGISKRKALPTITRLQATKERLGRHETLLGQAFPLLRAAIDQTISRLAKTADRASGLEVD